MQTSRHAVFVATAQDRLCARWSELPQCPDAAARWLWLIPADPRLSALDMAGTIQAAMHSPIRVTPAQLRACRDALADEHYED